MRSKIAQRILDNTPKEVSIYTRMYADILLRVKGLIDKKGGIDKFSNSPEVNKLLNGECDFSLYALARLEVELGQPIIWTSK